MNKILFCLFFGFGITISAVIIFYALNLVADWIMNYPNKLLKGIGGILLAGMVYSLIAFMAIKLKGGF